MSGKEDTAWQERHGKDDGSATRCWMSCWRARIRPRCSTTLIDDLKKAVAERALDAEMEVHLGRESEQASGNHRNGHNRKLVSAGLGYRRRHLNSTLACTPRRCATTETESPDR